MPATLTGTPVAITWAAGASPAAQNITIPADATGAYAKWAYDGLDADGHGLASGTLNGNAPTRTFELPTAAGYLTATGVAFWYLPATGTRSLQLAWDAAPVEGPVCIVFFTKDGPSDGWRDAKAAHASGSTPVSVTLTTESGDLCLKLDQRYDGSENPPSIPGTGWTSAQTTGNVDEGARLSYISATTTTQVCNSEDESYSSILAISIPEAASDTTAPTLTSPTGTATGSTTADGTVSTDEANGTAYAVVTTSGTAPTAAQVRAGQDNTGAAAAWSGSQAVSTTGTKTFNATGLSASTAYYFHFHHRDAANNDSTVVSSAQFTTSSGVTTVCNPMTGRGGSAAQPLAS